MASVWEDYAAHWLQLVCMSALCCGFVEELNFACLEFDSFLWCSIRIAGSHMVSLAQKGMVAGLCTPRVCLLSAKTDIFIATWVGLHLTHMAV